MAHTNARAKCTLKGTEKGSNHRELKEQARSKVSDGRFADNRLGISVPSQILTGNLHPLSTSGGGLPLSRGLPPSRFPAPKLHSD